MRTVMVGCWMSGSRSTGRRVNEIAPSRITMALIIAIMIGRSMAVRGMLIVCLSLLSLLSARSAAAAAAAAGVAAATGALAGQDDLVAVLQCRRAGRDDPIPLGQARGDLDLLLVHQPDFDRLELRDVAF